MKALDALDWVVIAAYFLILLGVAWWVIRQKQNNTADYFNMWRPNSGMVNTPLRA